MDATTARTRPTSRRMASAKAAAAPRRSTSRRSPGSSADDEHHISAARWGGVALVIAALLAAITLAVVSPGEPAGSSRAGVAAPAVSPTPAAAVADARLPVGQPRIKSPVDGRTGDYAVDLVVEVPDEDIPKRDLTLVVFVGDEEVERYPQPRPGRTETVNDVYLIPGSENTLTVALESPAGLGPRSEPRVLVHDEDALQLEIISPQKGDRTYQPNITLTGTSEVGSEVVVTNKANDWDTTRTVGTTGEFSIRVPLKEGPNRILVRSTDRVRQPQQRSVRVVRDDPDPKVKLVKAPKRVARSTLPRTVRIAVKVTDSKDRPMEGASVAYSLGGGISGQAGQGETDADGTSAWEVTLPEAWASAESIELGVTVTSPYGGKKSTQHTIALK